MSSIGVGVNLLGSRSRSWLVYAVSRAVVVMKSAAFGNGALRKLVSSIAADEAIAGSFFQRAKK